MPKPTLPGAARASQRALDNEEEQGGLEPGYLAPEPPITDIETSEEEARRLVDAAEKWVQETSPGLTDDERRERAIGVLNSITNDETPQQYLDRGARAWASDGNQEDNETIFLKRRLWREHTKPR